MKDSEALRIIAQGFIDGMCSCSHPTSKLTGHRPGCAAREYRAELKRLFKLADKLDRKPSLTRKQWIAARCALEK